MTLRDEMSLRIQEAWAGTTEPLSVVAADAVLALLKERGATAWIDGPIYLSSDDSERIGVGTALVVLLEEAPYDEDDVLEEGSC